jgi:hypothetical protein
MQVLQMYSEGHSKMWAGWASLVVGKSQFSKKEWLKPNMQQVPVLQLERFLEGFPKRKLTGLRDLLSSVDQFFLVVSLMLTLSLYSDTNRK